MASKEELKTLIKRIIKEVGVRNQEAVSEGAGYKAKTLTQRLSNGEDLDAVYDQLMLVYGERLKKSTTVKSEPTIDLIAYSLKTLTDSHKILVESHRDAINSNKRLELLLEINLGASDEVSRLLKEEAARQRDPVAYIPGSLDKPEIHSDQMKRGRKKGISG